MAIQTLNTIKQWFRTSLKPTQAQFWDTWDSFRHKYEKVPVKDVEGIEELLSEVIPQIPTINGDTNRLTKIDRDSKGNLNLVQSNITDTGNKITINSVTEIDSQVEGKSGLRFNKLKNESKTVSEIIFTQDVIPTAGIDGTAYFPYGNIVKKVNLDKTIIDYYSFPVGCLIQGSIIVSPNNGDLFLEYFDGVSKYILVKFDNTGILSVLRSSILSYYHMGIDKNNNIYLQEHVSQKILRVNTVTSNTIEYYTGNLSISLLGFDLESNGYFYDYQTRNLIYKLDPNGTVKNFATLSFEIGTACVKPDGSLYITAYDDDDKNIYSLSNLGIITNVFASLAYKSFEPYIAENGYLYVHNNDYDNGLVYKISPTGAVSLFGTAGNSPRYMAVTNSGVVYISNSASYNLIRIASQDVENLLTLDENGNVILSDKDVASKSDFKTINGESIVGSGDIIVGGAIYQTLEEVLGEGNTDTTGNSIVMQTDWFESKIKSDSISLSFGKDGIYNPDFFTLCTSGDGGYIDYTDTNGDGNILNFRKNLTGTKSTFYFPDEILNGTLAVREDITLQKTLENGSEGIVQKEVYLGYSESDDSTYSTINMRKSDSESETGIGVHTSGSLDIGAKRINITSYNGGGSISTALINQNNVFEINANNSKLALKGGAGGISIDGQGGSTTLSGGDFGKGAIQMLSTMSATKIINTENSNFLIETQKRATINSLEALQLGVNGSAASIIMEMTEGTKPFINMNSYGNMRIGAEFGLLDIKAGTEDGQGAKVNNQHIVRTINGIEADIIGNVVVPWMGDMTTNTNQEVSGVKSFLNGKIAFRNIANTFSSFLSNSNTASRNYSLQDTSGTLMLSDAGNANLSGYGQAVQLLSSNGTPTRGGNVVNLFSFVQATPITINTATLNSILSGTILGNTTLVSSTNLDNPMLTTGKSFSGKMFGQISAISSATFNIILKVGSTTLLNSNSLLIPLTITNKSFEINYSFTVNSEGISGAMIANLSVLIDGMNIYSVSGDSVTIDTTTNKIFDIQFAYGATNTGNSITFKSVKGSNDVN